MSASLLHAAAVGAVFGIGAELHEWDGSGFKKGTILVISTLAAVALRAISLSFGLGTATGVFMGVVTAATNLRNYNMAMLAGGALMGGTAGYLLSLTNIPISIFI
jgi:hypothetical protein